MARLVFVNRYFHPDESASSRLLTDLAVHLGARHDVTVLCSRQLLEDPQARLPPEDRAGNVRVRRLWSSSFGRAGLPGRALDYATFIGSVLLWLLMRLRRGDVVIAKTDPPMLGTAVAIAASIRRARLVNWLQDVFPETAWRLGLGSERSLTGRALRGLRNAAVRAAALNVVISPGMADFVQRAAGAPAPEVIPNWADDMPPATGELRRELGLQDRFVVGYSGNLGRAHPIEPLLALAEALRAAPVHFLFTGGGANMERLRIAVEGGRFDHWTFLPYQPREQLAELLGTPDLHLTVLDPRLEQLIVPSKLYGVMAAGRPVMHIGDPEGEVAQALRRFECGWTFAPGDMAAAASQIASLASHPDTATAAGARARRAFAESHARASALARWDEVLAPLLRSVAPAGKLE